MCENSAYTNTHFSLFTHTGGDVKRFNYKTLKRGAPPKKVGIRFGGDPAARLFLETCWRSLCRPKKWRIDGQCCQILIFF